MIAVAVGHGCVLCRRSNQVADVCCYELHPSLPFFVLNWCQAFDRLRGGFKSRFPVCKKSVEVTERMTSTWSAMIAIILQSVLPD